MEFSHSFIVDASVEQVWELLSNVEKIAPCLPGAQLTEIKGEEYHGVVKVKVGPITSQYKGVATMDSIDQQARRMQIAAQGRDSKGAGNAKASIAVAVESARDEGATRGDATGTTVKVDVDLGLTGRVAQFGRGVLNDVSAKLMEQFARNLSDMISEGGDPVADAATPEETETTKQIQKSELQNPGPREPESQKSDAETSEPGPQELGSQEPGPREPEAVDLLQVTGAGRIKSAVAVVSGVILSAVLFIRRKFRRKKV